MTPEVEAALARIERAVAGKPPGNYTAEAGTKDGKPILAEFTPLAEVVAQDVVTLCDAVPADRRTPFHDDLRGSMVDGSLRRKCLKQTQCLWALLVAFGKTPPPDPA